MTWITRHSNSDGHCGRRMNRIGHRADRMQLYWTIYGWSLESLYCVTLQMVIDEQGGIRG